MEVSVKLEFIQFKLYFLLLQLMIDYNGSSVTFASCVWWSKKEL